jgi:hypothetical protein
MNLRNAFSECLIYGVIGLVMGMARFSLPAALSQIKPDEQIEFFPAAASLQTVAPGEACWRIPLQVHVFETEPRTLSIGVLAKLIGLDTDAMTEEERRVFADRARRFVVDNQRQKRVPAQIAGREVAVGPTSGEGTATAYLDISPQELAEATRTVGQAPVRLKITADTNHTGGRIFAGEVFLVAPRGWTIISDIDDTIKVSEVRDSEALLKNTFCRPFKPVDGMAALYQGWQREQGCAFFYVSGSPWALYQPLQDFLQTNRFPAGVFHLRRFNFGNATVFNLFKSPVDYKIREISAILAQFPERQYILVGDSGEMDPEIYGTLAREHADNIRWVFIRDVTGEAATTERYRKAFNKVPPERWRIFREPKELKIKWQ